jgi:hypothetical protein
MGNSSHETEPSIALSRDRYDSSECNIDIHLLPLSGGFSIGRYTRAALTTLGGVMLPLLFLLLLTAPQVSRKATPTQDEIVLFGGDLAAFSLSNGISMMQMQSQLAIQHQEPELKIPFPVLLQSRHEMVIDWTDGQHARYLMEEIRQGV